MTEQVQVVPLVLTAESWQPFGWLPVRDTDPSDGQQRLHFEWQDAHVNVISHQRDEVATTEHGLVCDRFFRHLTHTQVLLVLNCPAVIAVAPSACSLQEASDLLAVRAFRLGPHDAVVLAAGVWHWGPFPVGQLRVDLFNVQGLRYAEDNTFADIRGLGGIEVVTDRDVDDRAALEE
jgi:ureidoglycolate hydrolase